LRIYNKMLFLVLVGVFMTIAGCSSSIQSDNATINDNNENYVLNYTGESTHWTVYYDITVTGQGYNANLDIKPKNKSVIGGEIEYTLYKNGTKKTRGTQTIDITKIGGTSGVNDAGAKPNESSTYAIQIKWDDKEEVFPLSLVKNTEDQ